MYENVFGYFAVVYVVTRAACIDLTIINFSPPNSRPKWLINFVVTLSYLHTVCNPLLLLIIYVPVRKAISNTFNTVLNRGSSVVAVESSIYILTGAHGMNNSNRLRERVCTD